MSYILILIGCVFVNNVVLSQFMGICPFLGVSKQMKSSVGMGAAVIFVMICATAITYECRYHAKTCEHERTSAENVGRHCKGWTKRHKHMGHHLRGRNIIPYLR